MCVESAAGGHDGAGVRVVGHVNAAAAPAPGSAGARGTAPKRGPPEAILADAVKATGGAAAWNAHKTAHYKVETTLQGMGMGGTGERFQTRGDKSLMTMTMAGLGVVREGTNGKVAWTEDPVLGIRYLDGAEAEQTRIASSWNADMHAGELFAKLEAATEPGPDGAPLECVVATPQAGLAAAQLLRRQDAPSSVTVRNARRPARRRAFSGDHPRAGATSAG